MKASNVLKIALPRLRHEDTEARLEAARLWNRLVKLHRWFRRRHRPWPSASQFEQHFKGRFHLHSQTVQALIQRFFANIETAHTNRKNGDRNARYPHKLKRFVPVIWKGQAVRKGQGRIILPMGRGRDPIEYRLPATPEGRIAQVELGFRELRITLSCEVAQPDRLPGIAAADLGLINLAVVSDGEQSIGIVGRGLRSIMQWQSKKKAALSSLLSRCKRGSRRWRKLKRTQHKARRHRDNIQRNLLHHAANAVVGYCEQREIGTLVVGDITEISRGKRRKMSRRTNQENSNNPLGQFKQYLDYKLKRIGCCRETQNEAYTTKTCPVCGRRHKPAGRLYRCICGFVGIRDEVGAVNQLNKYLHGGDIIPGTVLPTGKVKYLRPAKLRSGVVPLTPGKWLDMSLVAAGTAHNGEMPCVAHAAA
ncbi:MAG TPA: transposase [Gammaproteobacteria bacterium]|nr:transposase [Gammaproteobacteria bacterium]